MDQNRNTNARLRATRAQARMRPSSAAIVTAALCAAILLLVAPTDALAETYTASPLGSVQQYGIEALSETYETATARAEEAAEKVAESQEKVTALEADVDAQQARAETAARDMYLLEQNGSALFDVMLGAQSLDELLKYGDYLERATRRNASELSGLKESLVKLEEQHAILEQAKQEADAQKALAREALVALQDQRAAKQRSANATDGADWYMSEDDFVAEWAPRIDAYLQNTAMAGTGESFARASWRYCVDPRWSPAISYIESSNGAKCIRPHNAWGWGAADSDPYNLAAEWSTWDEAIDAHVKGLARGYGYTISKDAAKTYCPPNWKKWYETTREQMALI